MEIVETSVYTEEITKHLSDEEYQELQKYIVAHPLSGDLIKGSGGLRKLRWKTAQKGKSGGIRNIYYFYEAKSIIYMIFVYDKSKVSDLTPRQIELLRREFIKE